MPSASAVCQALALYRRTALSSVARMAPIFLYGSHNLYYLGPNDYWKAQ